MWHAIWSLLFLFIGWDGADDHAGQPAFIYQFMSFALFLFRFVVAVSIKLRPEYKKTRCSLEKLSNPLSSKHQPINIECTDKYKALNPKVYFFCQMATYSLPFLPSGDSCGSPWYTHSNPTFSNRSRAKSNEIWYGGPVSASTIFLNGKIIVRRRPPRRSNLAYD